MAFIHLLIFGYCFGVAWGLTGSVGNSSAVSVSYHNSTTTPVLESKTTIPYTTTPLLSNATVPQITTSSLRQDGPYLSSGFATSSAARGSGYEVLPITDRNGNTTRPSTAVYPVSNSTLNGTSTKTIHATGSGFDYASSCESLTRDWLTTSSKWFSTNKYSSLATNTIRVTETLYSEDVVPVTRTSCLGYSREIGGQTLAQWSTGETVDTIIFPYLTPVASPYTVPTPTCTFDTDSCNLLWDEYDAYTTLRASVWPAAPTVATVSKPMCKPYRPNAYCDKCTIQGNWADVYYWPMEAVGEPCDPDRSFVTAAPTIPGQPNTVLFGSYTFTSPTVYVSIDWLKATNTHGSYCGGEYSSTFLPFKPEEVSSIRFSVIDNGYETETVTYDEGTTTEWETFSTWNFSIIATATVPVFFGDFMDAVPAAAYSAQSPNNLYPGAPTTDGVITDAKYSPRIYLPIRVRTIDPYWSNCEVSLHGVPDPPKALTAASTVVKPVLPTLSTTINVPVPSSTTPAEPAGQPETPHASVTLTAASQSRSSSTAGAAQTGGPAEPSRTSSRVDPSSASPPTDNQSSQGSSPQDPSSVVLPTDNRASQGSSPQDSPPVVVVPAPGPIGSGNQNSGPSGSPGPVVDTPSSGSPQVEQGSTRGQQSITRIATSRQTPVTITLDSSRLPVVQSGSIAVVGDRTLTVGGSPVVIQGQQISLEPSGLRVESSETVRFPSAPAQASPTTALATAVWKDGDVPVRVVQENNAVVLTSGTETTTIALGNSAYVNGHRVDVPSSGGVILIDGSEIIPFALEAPSSASSDQPSGSTIKLPGSSIKIKILSESGERIITAEKLADNRVRLTSGSESIIIANGASAIVAGATVAVLADGSGVVVSGTSLIPLSDPSDEKARERLPSDSLSVVVDSGRNVLVGYADGTVTLADGAVTVVGGRTISATGDGGYVVVDGSVTQTVVASSTGVPEGEESGIVKDPEAPDDAVSSGSVGPLVSSMGIWSKALAFSVLVGTMIL